MWRFPNYIQLDVTDCGPTCLRIVAKHYGKFFSNEYLRKISFKSRVGTSMLGLSEAAEVLGFKTIGAKIKFEDLKIAPLPLIALWNQEHFVVVYKITKKEVYISDPAQGLIRYPYAEFQKSWATKLGEGIVLILEPTEEFFAKNEIKDTTKIPVNHVQIKLVKNLIKYRRLIIQLFIGLLISSGLQFVFPFLTQNIVDVGINTKDIPFIYLILLGQLFVFIGRISVDIIQRFILIHISTRININLVSEFFLKMLKLPISFFDVKVTGDIIQRLADHERVENFITRGMIIFISSCLTISIFSAVLIYYDIKIFGVFITCTTLFFIWVNFFLKKRALIDYKRFNQLSAINDKSIEIIQGMQEIKLNNAEIKKRWEWEYLQAKLFKINLSSLNLDQIQSSGAFLINEFGNIFITFYTATLVINGELTLGMMLAISYIIGQINYPVMQLIGILNMYQDAKLSMERINEIHNKENETTNSEDLNYNFPTLDIKLKNVSFKYDLSKRGNEILKNINVTFKANNVTAIVGESGSGKTTLMKLLLKIYDPHEGAIFLGDINFSNISHDEWRKNCGAVMQEGFIFSDTIINNIALGSNVIDKKQVEFSCQIANIDEFIDHLPLKYDTKIGPNGMNLSAGQKQRILIARSLYKNPSILLFDEATSSLDAKNEREIIENLPRLYKGKTVIVIAHRLSTVKNADNILVLDNGEITESGTHQELVKLQGKYFNLVKNQLELSM